VPTAAPTDTRRILVVFVAVMLGNSLSALDTTMVATALPTIVGDLGGLRNLSFVATAYLLTSLATMPLYGKLGDLYGRKQIFLVAVAVFLVGSVLCGTSESMTQLIVFRAVQGLGAGGLVSLPMAVVADLVPPRELGRWIGYSGFVFAFASVAGPLFGGFFAQHVSWRWAFFINVPLGLVSVAVVSRALHLPARRTEHRIDYRGATLLVGAVTCVVLLTSWGGSRDSWDSPTIIGLGVAAVGFIALLVACERRAREPMLPPRLFRISVARVCLMMNALVGLIFYATLYFTSAFLQFVDGVSATGSGIYLIPLMISTVISTMLIGRLTHRTGRYRVYPIVGSAIIVVDFGFLLQLDATSASATVLASAAVVGFGMGLIMQVLILAIQNAVEVRDLGVATAGSMFCRQFGGAVGLALLGSVFTARLTHWLPRLTPRSAHLSVTTLRGRPETLVHLAADVRHGVVETFARSLHTVFLVCVPVAVLLAVVAIRLRELPLREHIGPATAGDDLAIALEGAALEGATAE
jgi:EmrB/QacA subfamily drug resistance transporter